MRARHALLLGILALALMAPGGRPQGSLEPESMPRGGAAILIVGDSWVGGSAEFDEPWALQAAGYSFSLMSGGLPGRLRAALGGNLGGSHNPPPAYSNASVHVGGARSTGLLFGPGAEFDIISYVSGNPEITDVVLIIGGGEYLTGFFEIDCAHGFDPFDPSSAASGVCTVTDSIANLEYVFGRLLALGVNVHWQVHPAWFGLWNDDFLSLASTYQDAIEDIIDALETYCSGKACYPRSDLYGEACAGLGVSPEPTAADLCNTSNTYDYGDGGMAVNKTAAPMFFFEDQTWQDRFNGFYRVHPSGWGNAQAFRALVRGMKAADPTIATRFNAFGLDWDSRPAIPTVTIGTVTATTIQVTAARGTYVNGTSGTVGKCSYGDCRFVCWATCRDTGKDSADPACATGAESATARAIGSKHGAQHYEASTAILAGSAAPRDVVMLRDGESGVLRGLVTATDYGVVCVAVSPTGMSHPGVRNQTTP